MQSIMLLVSMLFGAGVATVNANPGAAANVITSSIQAIEKVQIPSCDCCPEWLCRLICSIVGPNCCQPSPGPCCTSGNCCGR